MASFITSWGSSLNFQGCLEKTKFPRNKGSFSGKTTRCLSLAIWRKLHTKKQARKLLLFFFFFVFVRAVHMEFPRPWVQLELKLLAYTTATATPDLSRFCNLHYSSWPHWILNPLSEARDRTCILTNASQICFCWAMMGTPNSFHSWPTNCANLAMPGMMRCWGLASSPESLETWPLKTT